MHIAAHVGAPSSVRHQAIAAPAWTSTTAATSSFSSAVYWLSSPTRSPSGASANDVHASRNANGAIRATSRSRVGRTPATASTAAAASPACQTR
jgi:hypothetical protein